MTIQNAVCRPDRVEIMERIGNISFQSFTIATAAETRRNNNILTQVLDRAIVSLTLEKSE
jgi:hypothetical protein